MVEIFLCLDCLHSTPLRCNLEIVESKIPSHGPPAVVLSFLIKPRESRPFLPPRPSSLRRYLRARRLRHGLHAAFTADLTALAPDCGHVLGEVRGR